MAASERYTLEMEEGRRLRRAGQVKAAVACFQRAAKEAPERAEPHNALGVAWAGVKALAEAERAFVRATELNAEWGDPWFNLGKVRVRRGDLDGAVAAWEKALRVQPALDAARSALGAEYRRRKQFSKALAVWEGLQQPSGEEALWVGSQQVREERYGKALPWLRIASEKLPLDPEALYARGVAAQRLFQLEEAVTSFRACISLKPDHAEAWNNLGNALKAQMNFAAADEAYREGIRVRPEKANTYRNRVFALQYDPAATPQRILDAHREYGRRFSRPEPLPPLNLDPARPLKIGLVSSDFGSHPVGYFLLPVVPHLIENGFQWVAYAGERPEDEITRRLRATAADWVLTARMSDAELAQRIRDDRIDILVDLGGHTRGSRIDVFGRKPAPIQVTWAGYVGTTGLDTMDWLLGDPRHTPDGSEAFSVERIWRLPDTYVCWEPPEAEETGPLPALRNGFLTFGCFNNLPKLNAQVIVCWSKILCDLPTSRLVLITKSLADQAVCADLRRRFAEHGVDPERLELSGRIPRDAILRTYADRIDLALDPFPYSGGLTTLEALWMGVPVLTQGGDRFASRHSLGHMGAMGLSGFVGNAHELALQWSTRLPELSVLRATLRQQMLASPLCDGRRFARHLGEAFRGMWRAFPR